MLDFFPFCFQKEFLFDFKDFLMITIVIYGMGDDRCEDLLIV